MHTTHKGTGYSPGGLLEYLGLSLSDKHILCMKDYPKSDILTPQYGKGVIISGWLPSWPTFLFCEVRNIWFLIHVTWITGWRKQGRKVCRNQSAKCREHGRMVSKIQKKYIQSGPDEEVGQIVVPSVCFAQDNIPPCTKKIPPIPRQQRISNMSSTNNVE